VREWWREDKKGKADRAEFEQQRMDGMQEQEEAMVAWAEAHPGGIADDVNEDDGDADGDEGEDEDAAGSTGTRKQKQKQKPKSRKVGGFDVFPMEMVGVDLEAGIRLMKAGNGKPTQEYSTKK